jgi:AcrR family transcriptional regulator
LIVQIDSSESDGRRRRGDRTRLAVAVRAAERASVDGLEGVSLGQIASDLGISKGGIQAVYRSKEELQLAAIAAARDIFASHVVAPAVGEPPGLRRLRALIEAWLSYVENRVFPGGCFMAATVPEFDSRPGPVRDALADAHRAWLSLLEGEVRQAQANGELTELPPPGLLAFEIDALLTMANTACNLDDQPEALNAARTLLDIRLTSSGGTQARPKRTAPATNAANRSRTHQARSKG